MLWGAYHKRTPVDIAKNPIIAGCEMCGEILQAGDKLKDSWCAGQKILPSICRTFFWRPLMILRDWVRQL